MRSKLDKLASMAISINRNEGISYYISFLFWPFGVMLGAMRHWRRSWSKNVFWLFCIFFGFTFIIAKNESDDAARHAATFLSYANSDMSLKELWNSFYSESSRYVDIVQPIVMYLVSRVSHNPSILFAVFGFIFGYFYSRNIWFILDQLVGGINIVIFIFIFTFSIFYPIWYLGNFRMGLAAQIFIYGSLPYLLKGDTRKLIWSALTVFVHFSFLLPVGILFLFIILKNRLNLYFTLFIVTSFIKELDFQAFQSTLLSVVPDVFSSKVTAYVNPEYIEILNIQSLSYNWYIPFADKCITWGTNIVILYAYLLAKNKILKFPHLNTMFCFSLLFCCFGNILSNVPSGYRYLFIGYTFMYAFLVIFISTLSDLKGLKIIELLSVPLILFYLLVQLRIGMDYYGLMTIFGNPLLASINDSNLPLIVGIKNLFF